MCVCVCVCVCVTDLLLLAAARNMVQLPVLLATLDTTTSWLLLGCALAWLLPTHPPNPPLPPARIPTPTSSICGLCYTTTAVPSSCNGWHARSPFAGLCSIRFSWPLRRTPRCGCALCCVCVWGGGWGWEGSVWHCAYGGTTAGHAYVSPTTTPASVCTGHHRHRWSVLGTGPVREGHQAPLHPQGTYPTRTCCCCIQAVLCGVHCGGWGMGVGGGWRDYSASLGGQAHAQHDDPSPCKRQCRLFTSHHPPPHTHTRTLHHHIPPPLCCILPPRRPC